MKIKTSELTGAALDWAVAKCEGYQAVYTDGSLRPVFRKCKDVEATWPSYSTNWAQGMPIIARERISIRHWTNVPIVHAYMPNSEWSSDGESVLVAAMRAFVSSKLGDEVEVPDELV